MVAVNSQLNIHSAQPSMDWTNVREVYRKLQDDFHLLTEPFGIFVPSQRNLDLSQLIGAIDVVDRELDQIESAEQRELFIASVLEFLRDEAATLEVANRGELLSRMSILKETINRLGISDRFCDTVRQVVDHGEAKRLATTESDMIAHLIEEWRLTGVLPVLFLGDLSNSKFEKFFYLCCATMPAIDMLQDALRDYRVGQISIRPTVRLYLKLAGVFCKPLPRLLWLFPKPMVLVRYAFGFIWQGIRSQYFAVPKTA